MASPGRPRGASTLRWRTVSYTWSVPQRKRGETQREAAPNQSDRRQGKPADRARPAEPDDRAADPADADVHAWLRHQPGHQTHSSVCVRPRRQPAIARLAETV